MADFSTILKELRNARSMTQDELAKTIGVSRSTIGMYENGSREPDFETLETIADFFNVDIDFLLGRTNKTTFLPQSISTIAAHFDGSEYTEEELEEIRQFAEFVKNRRK